MCDWYGWVGVSICVIGIDGLGGYMYDWNVWVGLTVSVIGMNGLGWVYV